MSRRLIFVPILISLFSCGERKPTINPKGVIDTVSVVDDRLSDTTKVLVASFPIKFDSTDVLLTTVGLIDLFQRGYNKSLYSSYDDSNVSSGYYSDDRLSGDFINIVFRDKSGNERRLTDKKMSIGSAQFLRNIYKTTKIGYILYSITDRDSNGDKELTGADLEALYISKLDGTEFKKLTKELHEFYDWSQIKGENKIYFRTLEDRNGDGELTNKDKFHYYYINFENDAYVVTEYNPLKIFE